VSLDDHLTRELAQFEAMGLLRRTTSASRFDGRTLTVDGRAYLSFASNDYLGLASSPVLAATIARATAEGVGAAASRLVSGTRDVHLEAQRHLAELVARPASLLFGSGYAANTGTISALVGEGDAVFSDELNHASLIDGARLSRARVFVYDHADITSLESLLRRHRGSARHALLITESVFSMDGDLAPLTDLAALARAHDAWLMLDEAHAIGVIGSEGRGLAFDRGVVPDVLVGTLGKALGLYGAFAAGSQPLVDYLYNRARSFVFSTGLPPPYAAAAPTAVALARSMRDDRERIARHRDRLVEGLEHAGVRVGPTRSAIVPAIFGSPDAAQRASSALLARGIHASAIRPPTVPEGTSRIRLVPTAAHHDDDLDRLIAAFHEIASDVSSESSRRHAPPHPPIATIDEPREPAPSELSFARPRAPVSRNALHGWFITGTGTGVGKTVVAVALARALAERAPLTAIKPFETGCTPEPLDAIALAAAARRPDLAHAPGLYRAAAPLAPWAATLEGEPPLPFDAIVARVRELAGTQCVLVEGAGGLLVPLSSDRTIADFAAALALPLLVVARDELGVLSRVLETVEAAERRALTVAAVVLNRGAGDPDRSRATNREILQARLRVPIIVLESGVEPLAFGRQLRELLMPEPASLRARAP
jgi:8-amino-7-oxononanoate synthase